MALASKTNVRTADNGSAGLPSITEVGRIHGAITRREATIDLVSHGRGEPKNEEQRRDWAVQDRLLMTADRLLFDQMDALRKLIATMPAKSLSDAVVQINVAGIMIMKLTTNDCDKDEQDELSDDIERIMISVIGVLAEAAGLDMVEYAFDELAILHDGRFPAVPA